MENGCRAGSLSLSGGLSPGIRREAIGRKLLSSCADGKERDGFGLVQQAGSFSTTRTGEEAIELYERGDTASKSCIKKLHQKVLDAS